MKKIAIVLSAGLALAGTTAIAQENQEARTTQANSAQEEEAEMTEEEARMQEVQCRTEPVTGSRTRVNRTCLTRAEWRALEGRNRENVNELQGRASGGAVCARDSQGGCTF